MLCRIKLFLRQESFSREATCFLSLALQKTPDLNPADPGRSSLGLIFHVQIRHQENRLLFSLQLWGMYHRGYAVLLSCAQDGLHTKTQQPCAPFPWSLLTNRVKLDNKQLGNTSKRGQLATGVSKGLVPQYLK